MARAAAVALWLAGCLSLAACHSATDPTPTCYVAPPEGTNQSALSRVLGPGACGTGGTSVTSFAVPEGTFAATIRFVVRGAKPNTTYFAQRAAELGRPLGSDGVCQRADGLPPWSAANDALFITFPIGGTSSFPGSKVTLTTDDGGDGSLQFEYRSSIPARTEFDVEMRLVDGEITATSELRSGCMTVRVQ